MNLSPGLTKADRRSSRSINNPDAQYDATRAHFTYEPQLADDTTSRGMLKTDRLPCLEQQTSLNQFVGPEMADKRPFVRRRPTNAMVPAP